jgi:predicted ATPase
MKEKLDKLTISGFKSIRELHDLELKNLNVLVGANGAGKSNLLSFFQMLHLLMDDNLNVFVNDNGGMNDILYHGPEGTKNIFFEMYFGIKGYKCAINPTVKDAAVLVDEGRFYSGKWSSFNHDNESDKSWLVKEANAPITTIDEKDGKYSKAVFEIINSWRLYHFNNTDLRSKMRGTEIVEDKAYLRADASNIAPFLRDLQENSKAEYEEIVRVCKLVLPYFKEFQFHENKSGKNKEILKVSLGWRTKYSDYPLQSYHWSDGSIRFICLATTLLQPNLPSMIMLDEPELGLHPEAIKILGELIASAAKKTQVVVTTQSPLLIDQFGINDIIVVSFKDGESTFKRLDEKDFNQWLEDYSVGELWVKNVICGGSND